MIHYGKNSENELELHLSGPDVAMLYRAILSARLVEHRSLYCIQETIERDFKEEISSRV